MRTFLLLICGVIFMTMVAAELSQQKRREWLEKHVLGASVQVVVERNGAWRVAGSGTVFKRNGRTYVVTAAHVVEHSRETLEDIDDEGKTIKRIKYRDVWVAVERVRDGRKTSELRLLAKVRFATKTEEEGGDDVAVLEVYESDLLPHSAVVLPHDKSVWVGATVWHCGSLYGEFVNSLARGNIAAIGRIYEDKTFHQTTATGAPGSSGGGVFMEDDEGIYYIGMLTRGIAEQATINFIVPLERIREALSTAKDDDIKNLLR